MDEVKGGGNIRAQISKGSRSGGLRPADQHIVPARSSEAGNDLASGSAKTPLRAVARNGIAHLLGAGVTDPDALRILVGAPLACLKHQTGPSLPTRSRGRDEICPALQDREGSTRRTGGHPGRRHAQLRPTGACGRSPGAGSGPGVRPWLPYARESHGAASARGCSADKSASSYFSRSRQARRPAKERPRRHIHATTPEIEAPSIRRLRPQVNRSKGRLCRFTPPKALGGAARSDSPLLVTAGPSA